MTTTLTLNMPAFSDIEERELSFLLATKLYETQKFSLGQAADMIGISKRTFTDVFWFLIELNCCIFALSLKDNSSQTLILRK